MKKENEGFDALVEALLSKFEYYPEIEEITEKHKPMLERVWDDMQDHYYDPESQLKIIASAVFRTAELEGKLPQGLKPKLRKFHQFHLSHKKEIKRKYELAKEYDLEIEKTKKHDL